MHINKYLRRRTDNYSSSRYIAIVSRALKFTKNFSPDDNTVYFIALFRQDSVALNTAVCPLSVRLLRFSITYLLTYLLTYSMQQSPSWEANWFFAANQEIPRILWNPKVHYRTHKRPSPVPILSQLHPVPTTLSHFLKVHLNIILPCTSWSPKWSLSLRFPHQNLVGTSPLLHTRHWGLVFLIKFVLKIFPLELQLVFAPPNN